jgi:outer membrane protein assembly factor BamD (BamD/ComL family)
MYSNFGLSQERKIHKAIEYIQTNEFEKAEESIQNLNQKATTSPLPLMLKSHLLGSRSYSKYDLDSSFIYYSLAIEKLKKLEEKQQVEICVDFKLCLVNSQKVMDSMASVALQIYKSYNNIEKMRAFNKLYEGTSSIKASNDFIEELYYKNSLEINTTSAYLDFLSLYPKSSKKDELTHKIYEIEFNIVVSKNDKNSFQNYIETYPNSNFVGEVRNKIERLDYEKTKSSDNLNDFTTFTRTYPNSQFEKELLEIYERPFYDEAVKKRDLKLLNNFKLQYPKSKYLFDVNELICEIAFQDVRKVNTRNAYREFVRLFPNSKFEEEAQKKIVELFPILPKLLGNGKYKYIDKYTGEDIFGIEFDKAELFKNNQAIVVQNSRYGVIDEFGKMTVPCDFDNIRLCENPNFYLVTSNERNGLYNIDGKKILNVEYKIDFSCESMEFIGFNPFYKEESYNELPELLFRIVNKELVRYSCPYDELPRFDNGLAIVSKGNDFENMKLGTYAVINKNFQEVIPFKYNYIYPVYQDTNLFYFNVGGEADYLIHGDGLFPYSGKWGLINRTGKILIPAIFDKLEALYLSNKSNSVYFVANHGRRTNTGEEPEIIGNCGLIDIDGNEIIPFEYQEIIIGGKNELIVNKGGGLRYSEGGSYVSGGRWGVVDFSHKVKVPLIYDEVSLIENNYIVRKGAKIGEYNEMIGGKYGVINSENKLLIPITYDYIDPYSSNELIFVSTGCNFFNEGDGFSYPYGGKWGAFDQTGKLILNINYSEIFSTIDSNLVKINSGKLYGNGYLGEIKFEGKFGLSDCSGKLILPVKFDEIEVTSNFIFVRIGDKYQIYSKQGVLMNDKKYDYLNELSNNYISFRVGEKNGIMNPDASEFIPAKFWATKTDYGYEYAISYEAPYFHILEAGYTFYATEKGEIFKE